MKPFHLAPNQLHRFYRGGARIAELRRTRNDDPYAPEEWIASMTSPFGGPGLGLSSLPDGTLLKDAVMADPVTFLGPEHVDRFGSDVAVLIKLLDAGERLPVHVHPDDSFAEVHLGSTRGKTEAWIILEAAPNAAVYVGWKEAVSFDALTSWVEEQDISAMLGALHAFPAVPGMTIFVPAGTAHAIGAGIFMVELQQPTDFSVLLEHKGLAVDGREHWHLGLGFDVALRSVDLSPWSKNDVRRALSGRSSRQSGVERLFPSAADPFFRAERIRARPTALDQSFSVLVVTSGRGFLRGEGWTADLSRGDAVLIPYAAGECALDGVEAIRCRGPDVGSVG